MEKIFIVTPTYNSQETLESTIYSIYTQPRNLQINYHIQDGGSTDRTLEIIQKWQKKLNNSGIKFTYSSSFDHGMYDAIKKGFSTFKIGKNDWMAWINSDDQLSGLFTLTLAFCNNHGIDWVTGNPAIINKNLQLEILNRVYPIEIVNQGNCDGENWFFLQQEGTAWKKSLWDASNAAAEITKLKYASDYKLWILFSSHAQLYQTSYPLGFFNITHNQISQNLIDIYKKELESIKPNKKFRSGDTYTVNTININKGTFFLQKDKLKIIDKKYFLISKEEVSSHG